MADEHHMPRRALEIVGAVARPYGLGPMDILKPKVAQARASLRRRAVWRLSVCGYEPTEIAAWCNVRNPALVAAWINDHTRALAS